MSHSKDQLFEILNEGSSKLEASNSNDLLKQPFSVSKSWSQSKVQPEPTKTTGSQRKDLKAEMQEVINYFSQFKSSRIHTPCEGNSVLVKVNALTFYLGCKDSLLFCGSPEVRDQKHQEKFSRKGLKTAVVVENNQILIANKKNSIYRYQITVCSDPISKKVTEFTMKHLEKQKKAEVTEIKGLKVFYSQTFLTLENVGSTGRVCQWSAFNDYKNLFDVNCRGLILEVSLDYMFVVTGHEGGVIVVYDSSSGKNTKTEEGRVGIISCLQVTKNNKYLIVSGNQSTILVYLLQNMTQAFIFSSHSMKTTCSVTTDDERVLITGGNDGKVYLWDLNGNIEGFLIADLSLSLQKTVSIKSLLLDSSGVLFCISNEGTISSYRLPNLNQYYILQHNLKILPNDLMFGSVSNYSNSALQPKGFQQIHFISNEKLHYLDSVTGFLGVDTKFEYSEVVCYAVSPGSDFICLVVQNDKMVVKDTQLFEAVFYNFRNGQEEKRIEFSAFVVERATFDHNQDILVVSGGFQYQAFSISNARGLPLVVHKEKITAIALKSNERQVFSADASGIIQVHQVFEGGLKDLHVLIGNKSPIQKLWVDPEGVYLVSYDSNKILDIWEVLKGLKINTEENLNIRDAAFTNRSGLMLCMSDEDLKCLHVPSLICYFSITLNSPLKFCFAQGQSTIAVLTGENVYFYRNPLTTTEILPFGNMDRISHFYEKVIKLITGRLKEFDPFLNSWYIAPYGINIMHLYAYLDYSEFLEQGFQSNSGVFPSSSGFTPIDISLEMAYEDCLEVMYDQLSQVNPLKLWVLESSLIRLNLCPYYQVAKFYDLFLLKSNDSTLPKFYKSKRTLPIVATSANLLAAKDLFMYDNEWSLEGKEVAFKQSFMRINMVPGSQDSILLARSIGETLNGELFNSEFFKVLIQEKWKKVRIILYLQVVVYMMYLVLISIYGIMRVHWLFLWAFSINILLIVYEAIELVRSPIDYFRDKYNFCDLSRSFLTCFYFGRIYSGYEISRIEIVILVIITWFQAMSYFRLIDSTRYFINLLFAVISDIIPFLVFLLTVTLGMSVIYNIVLDEGQGYFHFLKLSWELNIGGFDTTGYGYGTYFIFFGNTLIIPIMLLNLLISIMSDTFDKVNNQLAWADGKELITMVIEAENIMFWNKNKNQKEFLHFCYKKTREGKNEQTDIKLRTKVNKLQEQNQMIFEELKGLKSEVRGVNQKLDEVVKFIGQVKSS